MSSCYSFCFLQWLVFDTVNGKKVVVCVLFNSVMYVIHACVVVWLEYH